MKNMPCLQVLEMVTSAASVSQRAEYSSVLFSRRSQESRYVRCETKVSRQAGSIHNAWRLVNNSAHLLHE